MSRPAMFPIRVMSAVLLAFAPVALQGQTIAPPSVPDTTIGVSYGSVPVSVANGQCSLYNWSIVEGALPPGLSFPAITALSNTISGTAGMPSQDQYTFKVGAGITCDSVAVPAKAYTIRVLAIKDASFPLPMGVVGRSYSHTLSAWGINFSAATTWSYTGVLPPGLSLTPSGQITGVPTTAGSFGPVTFTVVNGARTTSRTIPSLIPVVPELAFVTAAALPTATVGFPYSQTIQTTGGLAPVSVTGSAATLGLSYNANTRTISGIPTGVGTYTVNLTATDSFPQQPQSVARTFTVNIGPPLPTAPLVVPDTVIGSPYSVGLTVPNGRCPTWNWSVVNGGLPPGLSFNTVTAASNPIAGTAGMPSQDEYVFAVQAGATCAAPSAAGSYAIRVLAIKDSGFPVPMGVEGRSYSHSFSAWGLRTAATWSATGLPPGLSMSASGQITGIPTTAQTYTGTVTVSTDNGARTTSRPIVIEIVRKLEFVTPATLPAATVGVAYSQLIETIGGHPTVSVTGSGGTAFGLSYNQNTRTISGTPTGAGPYTVLITATDSFPQQPQVVARQFTVNFTGSSPTIAPLSVPDTVIGSAYDVPLTVQNGQCSTWAWSLVSGALPPGLSFPAGTSVSQKIFGVAGMPSQDLYTFRIRAGSTCGGPGVEGQDYSIRMLAIRDSSYPVPMGVEGRSYSHSFSAWGLNPGAAATWSATGLPAGLSMSASGQITGTPTLEGTYSGIVRVSAENGQRQTASDISIQIFRKLEFVTSATLPAATVGVAYSQLIETIGGRPTVSVTGSGATAFGLSYNQNTRTISGTPTGAGPYTVLITATDSVPQQPQVVARQFTVNFTGSSPTIAPSSVPDTAIGSAYDVPLTVQNGQCATWDWSVLSGALPPGLSFPGSTAASQKISGTAGMPSQDLYTFRIRAGSTCGGTGVDGQDYSIRVLAIKDSSFPVPMGVVGRSYIHSFSAWGLNPGAAATWSATGLPPGLSMSAGGQITGTPTADGIFPGIVRLSAENGARQTASDISIQIVRKLVFVTSATLPAATVGVAYSQTIETAGGHPTVSVTGSGATAFGLSYNQNTRTISGTPTGAGPYTVLITATDSFPQQPQVVSQQFTVNFSDSNTPKIVPPSVPDTTIRSAYDIPLTVQNGQCATWAWSVNSGTLPPGLSFPASTVASQKISGTAGMPSQDLYTFRIRAGSTCDVPGVDGQEYSIRVLAIKDSSLQAPMGVEGRSYSHLVTAWGLNPASGATWSATGLPPGLLMSAGGQITGTPTAEGTYEGIVKVSTDNGARETTEKISIRIVPQLGFVTLATLPGASVGIQYSQTIETIGGLAPVSVTGPTGSTLGLSFDPATRRISGTPTGVGTYSVVLNARDSFPQSPQSVFRTYTVTIGTSTPTIVTDTLPGGTVGIAYSAKLVSSGFGTPPTWSATGLPPGLTLDAVSGDISGTPTATNTYDVAVSAVAGQQSAAKPFQIRIAAQAPLDFTPGVLPGAVVAVPYSSGFTATGGDGKYVFSQVLPSTGTGLPPGLVLSQSGAVSGTPARVGDFTFTVRVTSGQSTVEKPVLLSVYAVPISVTPTTLPPSYRGEPYLQTLAGTSGTPPYVFQVGPNSPLPPGLTLSSAGVLSGTPTTAAKFPFSIVVTDGKNHTIQPGFSLEVFPPVVIVPRILPDATRGQPYPGSLIQTQGGTGTYTYSITAGALPTGLSLGINNGVISGTPSAPGSFQFTVQAADGNLRTDAKVFNIAIFDSVVITTESLPNAPLQGTYNVTIQRTGGKPELVWQISNGTLPPGIEFANGVFSGMATSAGTFSFDVTVTDQLGSSSTKSYTIVATPSPTIETGPVPEGVVGRTYVAVFTVNGGQAPFTWTAIGGLPPGLALGKEDGRITGTPTTAGVYDFVLRVEDAGGLVDSDRFTIRVTLGPVPAATITGISGTIEPKSQPTFGLRIASPYPVALGGSVVLTQQPVSGASDPAVVFSNGTRQMAFTIAAGSTTAVFATEPARLQTGTVAGVITVTGNITLNGVDATTPPAPVATLRVEPGPPVIVGQMTGARTSTGFELRINGYSTSRQVTQARVTLTPAPGFTLTGTQFTIDLSPVFTSYYAGAASIPSGSQFELLLPFTVDNSAAVSGVSVTLVNALGSSTAANVTF